MAPNEDEAFASFMPGCAPRDDGPPEIASLLAAAGYAGVAKAGPAAGVVSGPLGAALRDTNARGGCGARWPPPGSVWWQPTRPSSQGSTFVRFTKFKTKLVFTFGVYSFVWRHQVAAWLRDDFTAALDPGQQVVSMFIPFYGLLVLWRFLQTIQATQRQAGMGSVISPARAFWWSSLWFGAGPYINGQLNALDAFAQGKAGAAAAAPAGA